MSKYLRELLDKALPPVPTPAEVSGWTGPPVPLATLPPVPAFPLHTLPRSVAAFVTAGAAALHTPVDFLAVLALALLGAASGRTRAARLKPGWCEFPALWVVVVALPGRVKSAALSLVCRPFWAAERRWRQDHAAALRSFAAEEARYKQAVKAWQADGCAGDPPAEPVKPVLRQVLLDKFTGEALGRALMANPRGLAVAKDELSGLVAALDKYRGGRGDDKENLLSVWAGAPYKVSLAKDGDTPPLLVPDPFLGVAGMLTPDSLGRVRGDDRSGQPAGDGWFDRFLCCYPDPLPAAGENWEQVPESVLRGYADLVDALLAVDMVAGEDGPVPQDIPFDPGGRAAWQAFTDALAGRQNALEDDDPFRGVLAKLKGYGLRLCGLLWVVRRAGGEIDRDAPIEADIVTAAAELVAYFEAHARRCWMAGGHDRAGRVARRLVRWLADNPGLTAFTRSQAYQQVKDGRDMRGGADLDAPLAKLVDHGFVRPVPDAGGGRPGPHPQTFAVNPLWDRGEGSNNSGDFGDDFGRTANEKGEVGHD